MSQNSPRRHLLKMACSSAMLVVAFRTDKAPPLLSQVPARLAFLSSFKKYKKKKTNLHWEIFRAKVPVGNFKVFRNRGVSTDGCFPNVRSPRSRTEAVIDRDSQSRNRSTRHGVTLDRKGAPEARYVHHSQSSSPHPPVSDALKFICNE